MQKRFIILVIVISVLIFGIGIGVYYYLFQQIEPIDFLPSPSTKKPDKEAEKLLKERYPDILIGAISFSDNKVTIKTEDEKEYLLWLPRPKSFYENKNIQDGQRVEIQGKILDEHRIYVKTIK